MMASQHLPKPYQEQTREREKDRKQHRHHDTCNVWFHYLPSFDFARQFLANALPTDVAKITTTEEIIGVERSFGDHIKSYRANIELQNDVSLQNLETLLFQKWSQENVEYAAWMEVIPLERWQYIIVDKAETFACFRNVIICGGALVSSNSFVPHWSITESSKQFAFLFEIKESWDATFEHNRELIEIKRSEEMIQIPYNHIEDRLVVHRHECSWDIYFGLKHVPKVFKRDPSSSPASEIRAVSISSIAAEDLGNTSVIRLTIPDKLPGRLSKESQPDIWVILTRFKRRGFSVSYANVTDNLTQQEDLRRQVWLKTFDLEYGWQCLLSCGFKVTDSITPLSIQTIEKYKSAPTSDVFHHMASTAENSQFFDFEAVLMESLRQVRRSEKDKDELPSHFTMSRRLVVTPTRVIPLVKEPIVQNRIIRQYNDDYFIRVIFRDEDFTRLSASGNGLNEITERICKFMDDGFTIGDRKYEFLACSNSQLREHGVWFFCPNNGITSDKIRNEIGDLTSERCVATYVSRMGLCFSASKATVDINVQFIGDITSGAYCFTDGIGKISVSLAGKVAKKLKLDKVPSAFQIRYGGCKGVVAQDPTLGKLDKLHISTSMKKFESPSKHLEILQTTRPGRLHLNRQVITLMSGLGVPDHVFLALQERMLLNMADMLLDDSKAMQALAEVNTGIKYKDLKRAGISFTNEVFFRSVLMTIYKSKLGELTRKARIEIPCDQGRILMGTVDETAILEYGQVFVSYTKNDGMTYSGIDILETDVVVTKNPCFHPGDLRKFQAVDVPELHHLVDCIVFPQRGPRPHPDEMSGSDLDGDMYFVCWDEALFPPGENMDPMDFPKCTKSVLSRAVEVSDVTQFISKYIKNDQLGVIANAHVVHADLKDIFCEECEKLCKMHSDAVDFPKTGVLSQMTTNLRPDKYPDFMMKSDKPRYTSTKILGKLYHQCRSLEQAHDRTYNVDLLQQSTEIDKDMIYWGYEKFMDSARLHVDRYNAKILQLMSLYGIGSEAEIVTGIIQSVQIKRGYFPNERFEIAQIVKEKTRVIWQKSREDFFNEFGGEEHRKNVHTFADGYNDILAKASACYVASYTRNSTGKIMVSCPWILSDLLVKIKSFALSERLTFPDDSNQTRESQVHAKIGSSICQHFVSNDEERFNTFKLLIRATDPIKRKLKQTQVTGLQALCLMDKFCKEVEIYLPFPETEQAFNKLIRDAMEKYKCTRPLSFIIPTENGRVDVTFTHQTVHLKRTQFIRRQLQERPCYTFILTFLLDWARKYGLIGKSQGAVFTDVVFVILVLEILSDEDNTAVGRQYTVPQNTTRYERSWIPRHLTLNEKRHASYLLMKTLGSLKSILQPNANGVVDISVRDRVYPAQKRRLIPGKQTPRECQRMTDELLFAYQEIAKNRSVAVFFDQTIREKESMMFHLPLNVLRSVMYATTYVAQKLSHEFGAEVNFLDMPFRDTPGLMLEAWGSPEQLWNVRQSFHDLEENATINTLVGKGDPSTSDGAFKCVYSGSTSPNDRLRFTQYYGERNSSHKNNQNNLLYTASPVTPVRASDSTVFKQFFKERLEILRQDFVNTFHGDLWIALTFGTYYLLNLDRSDYTVSELESKITQKEDIQLKRGPACGYVPRTRGAFIPVQCNQRNVAAILNCFSFKLRSQDVKYQARTCLEGGRNNGLLIYDENLKLTELRLSDFKWMMVDICRGHKHDGTKRMDVRCKLQSGRLVAKNCLKLSSSVLTKTEENQLRIARSFIGKVTFAREKHIKYYRYEGHISNDKHLQDLEIEISTVSEYSDPAYDGTFSTVVTKQELTVVPKLPSLEEEDGEWMKYIEVIWDLIELFGERLDSE